MSTTGAVANVLTLIAIMLVLAFLFFGYIDRIGPIAGIVSNYTNANASQIGNESVANSTGTANVTQANAQLLAYALNLINKDRNAYGLGNVTLSTEPSAQQHSASMLVGDYFSHWDVFGMKPYMRYTLLGGRGAVSENIAYRYSAQCGIFGCSGDINVTQALQEMEYSMMYNDSQCCNNGHRDNILDPYHNQVSIGIAYNASNVYFTEDFIDNYIAWSKYGINQSSDEMLLYGTIAQPYTFSSVQIIYDSPVRNMTRAQLDNTSSYGYGNIVAGVVGNPSYYYPGIDTIVADQYSTSSNRLGIAFGMKSLMQKYGAGEYIVLVWLNRTGSAGSGFVGSTYTVFVNSSKSVYTPSGV